MDPFVNDLRYAQAAGVRVDMRLQSGEKFLQGVRKVNEEEGFVTINDPKMLGGDLTTRRVPLYLIESVAVTDIEA
jgi:hypothetical protein